MHKYLVHEGQAVEDHCEGVPFGEQLSALITLLDRELKRDEAVQFNGAPLSAAQFSIAQSLEESGSLTIGELASAVCCVPANMTALVDRLERKGFARRVARPADRRVTGVALTPEGRRALAETAERTGSRYQRLSAALSEGELQSLVGRLGSLYVQLVSGVPGSCRPPESSGVTDIPVEVAG